jgi:hypothetical protein
LPERQRSWKPPTEAERAKKRAEREHKRRQTLKENLWEKVEQGLKDLWRPYHGSTVHREESDGNQLIEKKKSGGHTPLNAAVMAHWNPEGERAEKIADARTELTKRLYRLATGEPFEVVCFAEIRDLFGSYGAGDSDLDELRRTAAYHGPASESAAKLRAVEQGIDRIVEMLIEDGLKNPDFWADFPLPGVPTSRTKGAEDKDRERYLVFEEECRKRHQEKMDEYAKKGVEPPAEIRVRNKAIEKTAERLGVARSTVELAVQRYESGYIREDVS